MDGKRAMRSSYTVQPPELPEEQEKVESQQERDNAAYASLKGHPGWELIKKDFQSTIDAYRSGKPIASAISSGKSLEDIGKLTMVSNAVADELEHKVLTVEGAALALEEDGSGRSDGPKRKGN